MSEPTLNALRRNELVQVLKDMLSATKNPADVEAWVYPVFEAVTQPPPVVIHAAEALGRWNCYGNSPSSHHGGMRFEMQDGNDINNIYETIAEIVLAAVCEFDRNNEDSGPQVLVHVPMNLDDLIDRVVMARSFISNTIGSNPAADQVASLEIVIDVLIKLKSNYLLVPKNE